MATADERAIHQSHTGMLPAFLSGEAIATIK
jgi:hypothetical protein